MSATQNLHLTCFVNLCLYTLPVRALHRSIGNPNDPKIQDVADHCLASDPQSGFGVGKCPHLLRCVLDNLPSDLAAGMQSGGNIVSLLPTILAIIGTILPLTSERLIIH